MIGLPTTVISRTSCRSIPAAFASSAVSFARQPRTTRVSSFRDSGFSITYETRLIRSSPKRICGFISPAEASTSPVERSQRWPATVVEPTSKAMPYARSWRPGQTPVIVSPSWTATVTRQSPLAERALQVVEHGRVELEPVELPFALERLAQPARSRWPGSARSRLARPRRSTGARRGRSRSGARRPPCARPAGRPGSRAGRRSRGRRSTCAVQPEPPVVGEAAVGGVRLLDLVDRGEMRGGRGDAVLRVLALGHLDLAAAADAAASADRVEVDAEAARGVEHRRPVSNRPRRPDGVKTTRCSAHSGRCSPPTLAPSAAAALQPPTASRRAARSRSRNARRSPSSRLPPRPRCAPPRAAGS